MTTSTTEEDGGAQAPATEEKLKPNKKALVKERSIHVAPKKGKPAKKASLAKKATKGKTSPIRDGSKTAEVLDLLKRSGGATLQGLMKATGWQAHSVRVVGKKMGLAITSTKGEDGERTIP